MYKIISCATHNILNSAGNIIGNINTTRNTLMPCTLEYINKILNDDYKDILNNLKDREYILIYINPDCTTVHRIIDNPVSKLEL
jgi:hypothetical protein